MRLSHRPVPRLAALLALAASALAGCASSRPVAVEGPLMATADARTIGYAPAWSTDLGVPRRDRLAQIELLDDMLVTIELPANVVSAVSLRDGRLMWKTVVGEPGVRLFNPMRLGRYVFISSENRIYTLEAETGRSELWNPLNSPIQAGPTLVNNYAIFGGTNGRVFAHDVVAGSSRWAYELTSGVLVRPTAAPPNNVVVADGGGVYALLDATTGHLLWRGRTFSRITARPAVTANTVFVASEDQTLYAVLRATGLDRWKYRAAAPLTEDPVALGNSVYLPIPRQGMVALDTDSGHEVWRLPGKPQPVLLAENRLLVSSGRVLGWIDNRNGQPLGGGRTQQLQTVVAGPNNTIVLVSPSGRMQRLDPVGK